MRTKCIHNGLTIAQSLSHEKNVCGGIKNTMTVEDIINELKKNPHFDENMKALENWEKKVKKLSVEEKTP